MFSLSQRLTRRKYVTFDESILTRALTLVDLTLLGVGSTVGVGFYILAGDVARDIAGPAVAISFLIAAIASIFAGLCYAEFGARVPKAGSAYVYSYVCVGEFVSFVIGWNLILEYVIGTASVARGYSAYVDELFNNKISTGLHNAMPINIDFLSSYPDFFAFMITMVLCVIISLGVKESVRFNNVFTGVNVFVILYTIIAASTQADPDNWKLTPEEVGDVGQNPNNSICVNSKDPEQPDDASTPGEWGDGGFAPYGFEGIMQGAATCFFGFVGFDVIATTGEEALRPARNIPLSISISLLVVFCAYFGMSCVITLALPYCLQDPGAPLIYLFEYLDMNASKWIVSIGAIFGFSASLLGVIFPMPRIIFAMASDGLLFRFLAKINKRFRTPIVATMVAGTFAACMALIFSLTSLIDMMSIGTLLAYTIVALCVMLLRYSEDAEENTKGGSEFQEGEFFLERRTVFSFRDYMHQMFNTEGIKVPNELTSSFANYATLSFAFLTFIFALLIVLIGRSAYGGSVVSIIFLCIFGLLSFLNAFVISRQPQSNKKLSFKVPLVPWIPAISTLINLYLMCNLSSATWIRFGVWMVIGFLIYFLYGIKNSTEELRRKNELTKEGKDNYGMTDELVIPPITIIPPTPMSSRMTTPNTSMKSETKAKGPSPLAKVAMSNIAKNSADNKSDDAVTTSVGDVDIEDKKIVNINPSENSFQDLSKTEEVITQSTCATDNPQQG